MIFRKNRKTKGYTFKPKGNQFEVNMWDVSEFITNRILPIIGFKPYPLTELSLMVSSILYTKPEYIFEWGTHFGVSARLWAETNKYFKLNTKIVTVDLPPKVEHIEQPGNKRGMYIKNNKEIIQLLGDGVVTSIKYAIDNKITNMFFFLDGDHEYKSVIRELKTIQKEFPNAPILLHDTLFQDSSSGYNCGPHEAINDFLKEFPLYKTINTSLGLPGMTLLLPQ